MRAKPLISFGLMVGALTLPLHAQALSLGRLTVQSGLGQPLSARIELNSAQKDELDSLAARIAAPSVYRDNNVQYAAPLARARVTLEQGPNNAPYLRISTAQAVNEPFLDLLVEVNWSTGRVTRDYTFLLDPPGTAVAEAQPVEPVAPIRADSSPPRSSRNARRAAESQAPRPAAADGGDSYTVRRGDSLSKIARQYKPETVSLDQMLVAMFRANEAAFEGNNMNRLRSGQILSIPSAEQASGVEQPEAAKVVKVQASDWRGYRDRVAAAAPASDASGARQASGGRIGTAVEDKGAAAPAGKDQLRVSREAAGKGAGTSGMVKAEDLAAKDRALNEANQRVAQLESTLRDMQKATQLKSQSMSDLQGKAEAGKAKTAEPTKTEPPKVEAPKSVVTPAPITPAPVTPPVAETKAPEPKAPMAAPPATPAPEPKAPVAVAPVVIPPEVKAPETKAPETIVPPKDSTAAPTPIPPKAVPPPITKDATAKKTAPASPSFVDDIIASTPTWAIGVGALGLLGGIAALVAARRRKTTKFEDSIISGTDIKTNTVFGSTGGGVVNTGDNSLASDFSREGLGNIDTDEVDPIAEAEVYLAYGRDAQAEEILKDALKKDPQRQEIYLKLLEIHAQHNKPSAFETVASELYSVSGGQGEVWHKAMALGRQLDPSNPMFTEAGSAAAFAAAPHVIAGDMRDIPPHAESAAEVFSVPPELKPEPAGKAPLDFHLDDEISVSPTSAPPVKTPASILAGAEEEVARSTKHPAEVARAASANVAAAAAAGAVMGTAAAAAAVAKEREKEPPPISFEPESIPRFDLDFKIDQPRPAATPKPMTPEPAFATAGASAPAPQFARPAAAIELDKLDLAFDPQRSTFEDPTPSVLDGQWHDAATKLDLAKAYQEMGDVEGAREILQEVLHEGDDQQKAEADALLAKLA